MLVNFLLQSFGLFGRHWLRFGALGLLLGLSLGVATVIVVVVAAVGQLAIKLFFLVFRR